jgi:hypothetical protein
LFFGCYAKKEEPVLGGSTLEERVFEEYDLSPVYLSSLDNFAELKATHDFYFRNESTEDVVLTLHHSSCGCTRVRIVPEKIAHGETATISLAFDLGYSHESRSESVIINTNLEHPKQLAYRLKATTFPRLELIKSRSQQNRV